MNYKKLHKELWTWLAENTDKGKLDWPGWFRNGGNIHRTRNFLLCL